MDLLFTGQMVKFLDNPGKPWMIGWYAIVYENLKKKIKLFIVITCLVCTFRFLGMSRTGTCHYYSEFYTVLFWFVIELLQLVIVGLF